MDTVPMPASGGPTQGGPALGGPAAMPVPGVAPRAGLPGSGDTLLGLPGGDARLREIICAAAPFHERSDTTMFVGVPGVGRGRLSDRVNRWLRVAGGDDAATRALLEHRAATGRGLGAGLRTVALRTPDQLPTWAWALVEFLHAQPATAAQDDATGLKAAPLVAFQRAAERLLPCDDGVVAGVAVTERGWQAVTRSLVTRLVEVCDAALRFELQVAAATSGSLDWADRDDLDVSRQGWLGRLEALPGLAYVVGLTCQQWRDVTVEMFERLRADLPTLRRNLWGWADPGPLDRFTGGAGDRHAGGRSVALLYFAAGHAVVYKPKDLTTALALTDLIAYLNAAGLPLGLATHTVLLRGKHGWEEIIAAGPCDSPDAFSRYYRRLGMLMRLMQLLEGRDLFADNLIAAGDQPVLVDVECVLYPRTAPPPSMDARQRTLAEALESSIVRTSMAVQPWVSGPDGRSLDLGCLSHAGDAPGASLGGSNLPLPSYRPWHGDVTADPWEHFDDVIAGYRDMQAALVANRDGLLAPDGPLGLFHGARVRYIWRNTFDCQTLLRASLGPLALVDGAAREAVLGGVLRNAFRMLHENTERTDVPEVAEEELAAFRELDVPLFESRTASTSAFTPAGREIPGHFEGTAWQRLHDRVTTVDTFDLDGHLAVLTACMEAARYGTETALAVTDSADDDRAAGVEAGPPGVAPRRLAVPSRRSGPMDGTQLLDIACGIADDLLAARYRGSDDPAGWLGLAWYPVPDLHQIQILPPDLLSGAGGVALFLAELFVLTGEPRYWVAAHQALEDIAAGGEALQVLARDTRMWGGAIALGGFTGPGAALFALARGGELLGDESLVDAARGLLPGLAAAAQAGRSLADVPFGDAGLLLNLLALPEVTGSVPAGAGVPAGGDPATPGTARSLAGVSLAGELTSRALTALRGTGVRLTRLPAGSRLLDLLPVGRDSIAVALAHVHRSAPGLVDDPAVVAAAVRAHRPDLATRSGRLSALAIAASGGAEAGTDGSTGTDGSIGTDDNGTDANAAPARPQAATDGRTCRELVATAGEALLGDAADGGGTGREIAEVMLRALVRRRARTGSWFGDRVVDDRLIPSAVDGTSAIGLLALHLIEPALPSLTLLH